jgi:hypothetical protein
MGLFFHHPSLYFQVQRTAAKAALGCADLGEVFAVAARITIGDYESSYREWFAGGEANQLLAETEAAKGHQRLPSLPPSGRVLPVGVLLLRP